MRRSAPALVVVIVAALFGAGSAHAASCRAGGTTVYRSAAVTLVVGGGGAKPHLAGCVGRARHRVAVALPTNATAVGSVARFGPVLAVLVRTRQPSGSGAAILRLDAHAKPVGPSILVLPSLIAGAKITGVGLQPGQPYLALSMSGDTLRTFAVADDGVATPLGYARAYLRPDRGVIHLDAAAGTVRLARRKQQATFVLLGHPGCTTAGTDLTRTDVLRVFHADADPSKSLYACELATGRTVLLGNPVGLGDNAIGDPVDPKSVTVAGSFVSYRVSIGYDPDVDVEYDMVANLGAALVTSAWVTTPTDGSTEAGTPLLTPGGTLVTATWVVVDRAVDRYEPCPGQPAGTVDRAVHWILVASPTSGTPRALDCVDSTGTADDLAFTDLRLTGSTLTWSTRGVPKSAPLT